MNENFKCPECGGELIEEVSDIYFCSNCKAMIFKNDNGEFEVRKAHRIRE